MTTNEITLNGERRCVKPAMSVAELLRELQLRADQVAVEQNQRLVRRTDYAATELCDGDVLEVVTLVGGG